jgi:hypothetical protein
MVVMTLLPQGCSGNRRLNSVEFRLRMGFFGLFYPWGIILQALAIVHFFRRRPEQYWFFVIIFLGPIGAAVYLLIEVVPDLGLLRQVYDAMGRRKRIANLEPVQPAEQCLDLGRGARQRRQPGDQRERKVAPDTVDRGH